jgi:hypothetical protein
MVDGWVDGGIGLVLYNALGRLCYLGLVSDIGLKNEAYCESGTR